MVHTWGYTCLIRNSNDKYWGSKHAKMDKNRTKSVPRAFPFIFCTFPLDVKILTPHYISSPPPDQIPSLDVSLMYHLRSDRTRCPKKFHPQKKIKIRNVQNIQIFRFSTSPTTVWPSSLITTIPAKHGSPALWFQKRMGSTLGRLRHSALVIIL